MKAIFIHHSTGANLLKEGNVRKLLKKKNSQMELWDHSYNLILPQHCQIISKVFPHHTGLSNQDGEMMGIDYGINIGNNSPFGYERLFTQEIGKNNAFTKVLEYDVIIFKNCYPTTKIDSDERLEYYKSVYLTLRDVMDKYINKLFILFTPPPLRKSLTKSAYATRAREFANWLKSQEFIENRKNIVIFDFFDLLAESDSSKNNFNMLKENYCRTIWLDSHPNKRANKAIGPIFVEFLVNSVNEFKALSQHSTRL